MGHEFLSPLRRWDILAGLAQSINAKTFVEVGCREGRTTSFMLSSIPDIKVIAVDPWYPMANESEDYKDWDYKAIETEFWKNVGDNKNRCEMRRMTSQEAADNQLYDMVFIDAGHDYLSCKQDIELWWPLIKEGGYLCGHDYQHKFPGVMRAVAENFPLLDIAVFPDSVWCIEKRIALKVAA